MNNQYIPAGKLTKTIGLNGALQLYLNTDFARLHNRIDSLYIDLQGQKVPYLVIKLQAKSGGNMLVELEDIDTIADAQQLVGHEVFVTQDILPTLSGNEFYHQEIIGYTISDKELGVLGTVNEVIDVPLQTIVSVTYNNAEVLIPLAGAILVTINRDTKTIEVNCPEGLVDMYLTKDTTPDEDKDGQGEEDEGPAFKVSASGRKKYFRRAKKK